MLSITIFLGIAALDNPVALATGIQSCGTKSEADVIVCGKRTDLYRIDPNVLVADRELTAPPPDTRNGLREITAKSCHDELTKCSGDQVLPLLPMVSKAAQVATLALKGEDWKEALRTRPDPYAVYTRSKQRQRAKVSIGMGVSQRPR
jgi:hypothetical protein